MKIRKPISDTKSADKNIAEKSITENASKKETLSNQKLNEEKPAQKETEKVSKTADNSSTSADKVQNLKASEKKVYTIENNQIL